MENGDQSFPLVRLVVARRHTRQGGGGGGEAGARIFQLAIFGQNHLIFGQFVMHT